MWRTLAALLLCLAGAGALHGAPDNTVQTITYRMTGLCYPERVDDLRAVIKEEPALKLVDVDYANARATFEYIPRNFPALRFRELLGKRGFGINPAPALSADKLTVVEIPIVGLDCKGCSFAAYLAIYKLDGVEQANVSFKEGRVRALIDPTKINRLELESALKKARVQLKGSEKSE
jgi:copper chaperone CopZ